MVLSNLLSHFSPRFEYYHSYRGVRFNLTTSLADGYIITDGQLEVWDTEDPMAGTVEGLIKAILEGRASVVVHTDDLDPDTPTGVAGDSRAGELRGTLQ